MLYMLSMKTNDLSLNDSWAPPARALPKPSIDGVESDLPSNEDSDDADPIPKAEMRGGSAESDQGSQEESNEEPVADLSKADGKKIEEKLPDHACAYCGIYNPLSVVRCVHPNCKKWFCNSRQQRDHGSHIIQHLVIARHRRIRLHKKSPLGEAVLDCYYCDSDNVFNLGFIPSKSETVVLLLCRSCVSLASQNDPYWEVLQWLPLINDRMLLHWLVKQPTYHEITNSKKITLHQIKALEELWSDDFPSATISDIALPCKDTSVRHAPLKYESGRNFYEIFAPLVNIEAEHDRKLKESQTQENVKIRWELGSNQKRYAYFCLPKLEQGDTRLAIGDELKIRYQGELVAGGKWETIGSVIKIPNNFSDEVVLELRKDEGKVFDFTSSFTVDFVWKSTSFDRMLIALEKMATEHHETCLQVHNCILGKEIAEDVMKVDLPRKLGVPDFLELNHSQISAVRAVLKKPFSLIQGPPGTGKTVTSAAIVYHLANMYGKGILVTAPSNVAVNQLTEKIAQTGLQTVRITARSKEALVSPVHHLTLHEKVMQTNNKQLRELMRMKEAQDELSPSDEKRLRELKKDEEKKVILSADVICCTCVSAGDIRLDNIKFHSVLVDEATQATEPECLIPLIKATRQAILVGDHKQLGPVVLNKKAASAGLQQSLFERLILLVNRPIRLQVQYRMHPCLSEFPSNMFYEGSLQNGVTTQERLRKCLDFPWPVPETPMLFHCSYGREELSPSGTSYINRTEATYVEKVVTWFLKAGIKPHQVGIVTPYEGQRSFLVKWMEQRGTLKKDLYKEVETASVDSFQGREMDYIILTCVRSNNYNGIGFLSDPRRLNVALTRAKYGLVILGNPKVLSKHPLWCKLIVHFKEKNCLVEGSLSNLKPAIVELSKTYIRNHLPVPPFHARPSSHRNIPSARSGDPAFGETSALRGEGGDNILPDARPVSSSAPEPLEISAASRGKPPPRSENPRGDPFNAIQGVSRVERAPIINPISKIIHEEDSPDVCSQTFYSQLLSMSQDNYLHLDYKSQVESAAYMNECYSYPDDLPADDLPL